MSTELNDVANIKLDQISNDLKSHDRKINELERWQHEAPRPEKLRHIEHIVDELPITDDLKECVKIKDARSGFFKRISTGVVIFVIGTLAIAALGFIMQGLSIAMLHTGGTK